MRLAFSSALLFAVACAKPNLKSFDFNHSYFHTQVYPSYQPTTLMAQGDVVTIDGSFSLTEGGSVAVTSMNGTKLSPTIELSPLWASMDSEGSQWYSNATLTLDGTNLTGSRAAATVPKSRSTHLVTAQIVRPRILG